MVVVQIVARQARLGQQGIQIGALLYPNLGQDASGHDAAAYIPDVVFTAWFVVHDPAQQNCYISVEPIMGR